MAPITSSSTDETHQSLLDLLDLHPAPRPFRAASDRRAGAAKPTASRRNKTVKQILAEASRKEASLLATQNNSGASTPKPPAPGTPVPLPPRGRDLSTALLAVPAAAGDSGAAARTPAVTYTNIEAGPSLHPQSRRRYCDLTGLPAPYTDPKSRLRYACAEVFGVLRTLPASAAESYLAARGAHTVLK